MRGYARLSGVTMESEITVTDRDVSAWGFLGICQKRRVTEMHCFPREPLSPRRIPHLCE